jgi:hypothetical protein
MANRIKHIFLDHPSSVGETYGEHFKVAMGFSGHLLRAACAAALHAFVPALCKTTASQTIAQLNDKITTRASTPAQSFARHARGPAGPGGK